MDTHLHSLPAPSYASRRKRRRLSAVSYPTPGDLPSDLLAHTLTYIGGLEVVRLKGVSKRFALAADKSFRVPRVVTIPRCDVAWVTAAVRHFRLQKLLCGNEGTSEAHEVVFRAGAPSARFSKPPLAILLNAHTDPLHTRAPNPHPCRSVTSLSLHLGARPDFPLVQRALAECESLRTLSIARIGTVTLSELALYRVWSHRLREFKLELSLAPGVLTNAEAVALCSIENMHALSVYAEECACTAQNGLVTLARRLPRGVKRVKLELAVLINTSERSIEGFEEAFGVIRAIFRAQERRVTEYSCDIPRDYEALCKAETAFVV